MTSESSPHSSYVNEESFYATLFAPPPTFQPGREDSETGFNIPKPKPITSLEHDSTLLEESEGLETNNEDYVIFLEPEHKTEEYSFQDGFLITTPKIFAESSEIGETEMASTETATETETFTYENLDYIGSSFPNSVLASADFIKGICYLSSGKQ